MKKFNIFRTNGKNDDFCCQIEARDKKSALRKYRKGLMTTGEYWMEDTVLYSSYGGKWKAVETL